MKKNVGMVLVAILLLAAGGAAQAQSVIDQLPLYVVGTFNNPDYQSLPVLKNFLILENQLPEYETARESIAALVRSWEAGNWQSAQDALFLHAEVIGDLNRYSTMDLLALCTLYYSFAELRKKMGNGTPYQVPAKAFSYLYLGRAYFFILFPSLAQEGPEDTRMALDYALKALGDSNLYQKTAGYEYLYSMANYMYAETYPKTNMNYFPSFNEASMTIEFAVFRLPENPEVQYLNAQIKSWIEPHKALKSIGIYMGQRPGDMNAYLIRGIANFYAERYKESEADLLQFLAAVPSSPQKARAESMLASARVMLAPIK